MEQQFTLIPGVSYELSKHGFRRPEKPETLASSFIYYSLTKSSFKKETVCSLLKRYNTALHQKAFKEAALWGERLIMSGFPQGLAILANASQLYFREEAFATERELEEGFIVFNTARLHKVFPEEKMLILPLGKLFTRKIELIQKNEASLRLNNTLDATIEVLIRDHHLNKELTEGALRVAYHKLMNTKQFSLAFLCGLTFTRIQPEAGVKMLIGAVNAKLKAGKNSPSPSLSERLQLLGRLYSARGQVKIRTLLGGFLP